MGKIAVERVVVLEDYRSNSYIVWNQGCRHSVIVDCGGEFYKIESALKRMGLKPR